MPNFACLFKKAFSSSALAFFGKSQYFSFHFCLFSVGGFTLRNLKKSDEKHHHQQHLMKQSWYNIVLLTCSSSYNHIALLFVHYSNSRAANWSPSKNRFIDINRRSRDMPGPGTYNPSDVDSSQGGYITSNFRNTGNVKFIKPKEFNTGMSMKGGIRSRTPMNNRVSKYIQYSLANMFHYFITAPCSFIVF